MSMSCNDLPSTVEQTLAACPQFRILVVGNTGVGKSSLISSVFNLSLTDIDVAHDRVGRADISFGYASNENPRFILHDSQGFEPGTTDNWELVRKFLQDRMALTELRDHVHAIWLCVVTPRTGSRLQQTGDEKLLELAKELKIPIIVVFTKFDLLVNENKRKLKLAEEDARTRAQEALEARLAGDHFPPAGVQWVRISAKRAYLGTLDELTEITRQSLHDVEGELWLPWASAQQISARQKVEQSIRWKAAKEQYWLDLGTSAVFKGKKLKDCLWRIYDDVLQVWNFHDPLQLLRGDEFFAQTLKLVEDFSPQNEAEMPREGNWLSQYSDVITMATAVGTGVAQALGGIGIGILAFKFIFQTYQALPQTARFLGVYIIDLTLVLHHIFLDTLTRDPPRPVTQDIVDSALDTYRMQDRTTVHRRTRKIGPGMVNFEQQITDLIREFLGT